MPSYTVGQAAELLGVSTDTVRRWVDGGQLRARRTRGGHRVIDGAGLARFAARHAQPDETTVTEPAGAQSARNRFPGIVTKVVLDKVMAQVELQAGPYRVVSLMSREAAEELRLAPGVSAIAVVKSTNVVVEVAGGA